MVEGITLNPDWVMPEYIQDISKLISQESKKVIQNMQREVEKIIIYKNKEVTCLKDHNEKLLT